MKLGTDNYIWDKVINPNMEMNLIPNKNGLCRGIVMSYDFNDSRIIVEVKNEDNLGTNYKNARNQMIKAYKEYFKEVA